MSWYKTGTASVTSGSNAVIGTGTSFIANSRAGDAFRGPDGEWYEVTNIASDTALSIAPNYQGASVAAGSYSLAPMQGYVKDSADALRAATQVIGQVGTDLSSQVGLATSAATAAQNSATSASTSETNAASSATSANSSKLAAKTSEDNSKVSETNSKTSETNASSSKTAAANSAAQAANSAASVANKASSGANNDITSLAGLTTALSISQGGTGAKSAANARVALELVPVSDSRDQTPGRLLTPGYMGLGGVAVSVGSVDLNVGLGTGSGNFITDSPVNGPLVGGSGYVTHTVAVPNQYIKQEYSAAAAGTVTRYKRQMVAGVWGAWVADSATWGSINGTLLNQADLVAALASKEPLSWQAYNNVTASRVSGSIYVNSTGQSINVQVTCNIAAGASVVARVSGTVVANPSTNASYATTPYVSFTVPAGKEYSVTSSAGFGAWVELRS